MVVCSWLPETADASPLESVNVMGVTFFGQKVFGDAVKDLEMGDYLGLSSWAPNGIPVFLVGDRGRFHSHTEGR